MVTNTKSKTDHLHIREYQEADHDKVFALIVSIIESEYEDIPSDMYLWDIDHFHEVYNGERDSFWIAEVEGNIIGTIAIKEDDKKTALMRRFFVNPHWRSLGVGDQLYNRSMEFCKEKNYKEVIFIANDKMDKVNKFLKKRRFKDVESIPLKREDKHTYGVYKLAYSL